MAYDIWLSYHFDIHNATISCFELNFSLFPSLALWSNFQTPKNSKMYILSVRHDQKCGGFRYLFYGHSLDKKHPAPLFYFFFHFCLYNGDFLSFYDESWHANMTKLNSEASVEILKMFPQIRQIMDGLWYLTILSFWYT